MQDDGLRRDGTCHYDRGSSVLSINAVFSCLLCFVWAHGACTLNVVLKLSQTTNTACVNSKTQIKSLGREEGFIPKSVPRISGKFPSCSLHPRYSHASELFLLDFQFPTVVGSTWK